MQMHRFLNFVKNHILAKKLTVSDIINVQKYVQLIQDYLSHKIEATQFETTFLTLRRNDNYQKSGSVVKSIRRVLNTIFLDVDEYTPEELYDPDDQFNINEQELRVRLHDNLQKIESIIGKAQLEDDRAFE